MDNYKAAIVKLHNTEKEIWFCDREQRNEDITNDMYRQEEEECCGICEKTFSTEFPFVRLVIRDGNLRFEPTLFDAYDCFQSQDNICKFCRILLSDFYNRLAAPCNEAVKKEIFESVSCLPGEICHVIASLLFKRKHHCPCFHCQEEFNISQRRPKGYIEISM